MLNTDYIRVLAIDLTRLEYTVEERRDLFSYLGGTGVASKLFAENLIDERDAFDPCQPVIFAIGPLSALYPAVTKTVAMFRSPLTGELGESHAGGRLAMAMRYAGYDAILIKGKAAKPVYLLINGDGVQFRAAEPLWGMDAEESGKLMRDITPGAGHRSIIRIGPAGENLVAFANANVDSFRHFGRLGLGAVLGSKNLKMMIVHGDHSYPIQNLKVYNQVYQQIYDRVVNTDIMGKYHGLGTSVNILPLNKLHALPTRNLTGNNFADAQQISGEAFAQENLLRKTACMGCPIGCIHLGFFRHEFGKTGEYEYETVAVPYDYELLYAFGTMLGINDRQAILQLIRAAELAGLDIISTGVALAWATEAMQKGLISVTEVGHQLEFGMPEGYLRGIRGIVKQENQFYRNLARGTAYAASVYGGQDFAVTLGKHEIAGYHTGYGSLLGMAVGGRHSHLDNAGYDIDQKLKKFDEAQLVEQLINEEKERNVLNSLVICLFARKVYDRETVAAALQAVGIDFTSDDYQALAVKIFTLRLSLKERLGFEFRALQFPHRFFETASMYGKLEPEVVQELLALYAQRIAELGGEKSLT